MIDLSHIAIAQLNLTIGDFDSNLNKIEKACLKALNDKCLMIVFSEMALTGYPLQDILFIPHFIKKLDDAVIRLKELSKQITIVIGMPYHTDKGWYNSACVFKEGELVARHDKCLLPNYDLFEDQRHFISGNQVTFFTHHDLKIALTVCEDIWHFGGRADQGRYLLDPLHSLQSKEFDLLINLSASPFSLGKGQVRHELVKELATSFNASVILANQVGAHDDIIFDGHSLAYDAKGQLIYEGLPFEESVEAITKKVQEPHSEEQQLYNALVLGLRDYFHKTGHQHAFIGLSGGVDSAVCLQLAVDALGSDSVTPIFMPTRFTQKISYEDARKLSNNLNLKLQELSIDGLFEQYLDALDPYFGKGAGDITEENLQPRIRGNLLMAFANKSDRAMVISCGNKSEWAMGYSTLYGDLCGGISPLGDLLKGQVYQLGWYLHKKNGCIPERVLTREPSAELKENQKDSDSLPDYEIVDCVVEGYLEQGLGVDQICKEYHYNYDLVEQLVRRIHRFEYKRRQAPFALRVSKKAFSIGRHFPIAERFW